MILDLCLTAHRWLLLVVDQLQGLVTLGLRVILAPVLLAAGWEKLNGENWFVHVMADFPFPFDVLPAGLSWFLAGWTEFLGGMLLLLGLGTRWICIPLMVTMWVAAAGVHADNGWAAIAPSDPPAICVPDTVAYDDANDFVQWFSCTNVSARTIEASKRLARARSILQREGNWNWLSDHGAIVKLNNGMEFAVTYLFMLGALLVIGGGRYTSLDWLLGEWLKRSGRMDASAGAGAPS